MQKPFKPPEPLNLFPEKLFYKIGEASEIVGVETHVLRYWETEFPFIAPRKTKSGQRIYTKREIDMILQIKRLLYDEKYTIEGARKRLSRVLSKTDEPNVNEPQEVINLIKNRLRNILNSMS